jgi:hypothetical protein
MAETPDTGKWTLLTAHGRALVAITQDPDARTRDLAQTIGVTERTAQVIVADLEAAGYISRERIGRRNRYTVHLDRPFRHPAQNGLQVGPLLDFLAAAEPPTAAPDEAQWGTPSPRVR